eukprot:scaffold251292_cov21-Prasinocladus_malaysianus.AAC.1
MRTADIHQSTYFHALSHTPECIMDNTYGATNLQGHAVHGFGNDGVSGETSTLRCNSDAMCICNKISYPSLPQRPSNQAAVQCISGHAK